jgi:hypothetical protein
MQPAPKKHRKWMLLLLTIVLVAVLVGSVYPDLFVYGLSRSKIDALGGTIRFDPRDPENCTFRQILSRI